MSTDKGPPKIEGIKCDNPSCKFEAKDIRLDEYKTFLNKPCPRCGKILLTEDGFKLFKLLTATTSIANKLEADPHKTSKVYQPQTKE